VEVGGGASLALARYPTAFAGAARAKGRAGTRGALDEQQNEFLPVAVNSGNASMTGLVGTSVRLKINPI
jgi:hypothetical protein